MKDKKQVKQKEDVKRRVGKPTPFDDPEYRKEIVKEILEQVSKGGHIVQILESNRERYPAWVNFSKWKREDKELNTMYINAQQDKIEAYTLKILETMEDVKQEKINPQAGRLLIDTYKWFASKYYPKVYGDKVEVDHTTQGNEIKVPAFVWGKKEE